MNDLISRLRRLESDHEPEGYPPVKMKEITALVDTCEALIAENQQSTDKEWHGEKSDGKGNVGCRSCGKMQSEYFKACIYCCPHNTLDLIEEYNNGWSLDVECSDCGKNFDFKIEDLIKNYKVVRRLP